MVNGQICLDNEFSRYGLLYEFWVGNNQDNHTTTQRINDMFDNFCTPVHGVLSVKAVIDSVNIITNERSLQPIRFFEKIIGLCLVVEGKTKTLPIIYEIRRSKSRMMNTSNYPLYLKRDVHFERITNILRGKNK